MELTAEDLRAIERSAIRRAIAVNVISASIFYVGALVYVPVQFPEFPLVRAYLTVVPMSVVYFVAASAHVTVRFRRALKRSVKWIEEERPPASNELTLLMRLPGRTALHIFFYWIVVVVWSGPVIYFVFGESPTLLQWIKSYAAILIACIPSCVITHLLVERTLRPIRARALADARERAPRTMGLLARLLFAWVVASGIPLFLIAFQLVGLDDSQRKRAVPLIWAACGAAALAGVIVTAFSARAITDPIHVVRGGLRNVGSGDLGSQIPIDEAGELGQLQSGFNEMVAGLRERERMRDVFGRHVGKEVATRALADEPSLDGEVREATAMFVDVVGSTPLAESLPPREVMAKLNAFFEAVIRNVTEHGGLVNQFQGDGAVCIFGAPLDQDDHAARALRAASALVMDLAGLSGIQAAIGVSSGSVVAGNIGTLDRHAYTVIGDPVNEASRLCDAAKETAAKILVARATIESAGASNGWTATDSVVLRGRSTPTEAFTAQAT